MSTCEVYLCGGQQAVDNTEQTGEAYPRSRQQQAETRQVKPAHPVDNKPAEGRQVNPTQMTARQ